MGVSRDWPEAASLWRCAELGGMEFLAARYLTHSFTPHAHETYAIGVVTQGALAFNYRAEQEVVAAGDSMLINPGQMHTGRAVGSHGSTYRMFYPSAEILMEVAGEIAGKPQRLPAFPVSRVHDPVLADLVLSLHRGSQNASISPLECESRLLDVLARLIGLHADESDSVHESRPWHSSVRHAVEFLQTHYAENVSLQQLASVENLSQFYLLRTFRNTVGVPPHVYQMQLRVRHARELLLRGFSPVQVAAETGFADQSHLTRSFRRVTGVTPGQYQRTRSPR
jgi:AraC-like DNA-binding protein